MLTISTTMLRMEYMIINPPEIGRQEYKTLLGMAKAFVTSWAKWVN